MSPPSYSSANLNLKLMVSFLLANYVTAKMNMG